VAEKVLKDATEYMESLARIEEMEESAVEKTM
jgi:hypothetical protein